MAQTVSELQVLVSADTSPAEKALGDFGRSISSGFGLGLGLKAFDAVWGGLTATITGSIGAASDFEKAMSGIKAVTGASAAEMEQLSATAKQLGADTSFSAKEAADGISELAKAGVSVADIMGGAAKASLDLAAAGGISVADAATIAANAMNSFNIAGADMTDVANTIAGAANASAIDVSQFKFSLQSVGAVAAQIGFSFKDTAVAIAELGQAGITGSDAGTSLRTMLMRLQPQTKAQTKLMQELGLITKSGANQFFDAQGKVKGMADVQAILSKALAGQTEQQKQATLATLFGSDAIRAAAVLAKNGAEGFNDMADAMGKVTAASVAEERLNNLQGSMEKLKGSVSTVAIEIGQAFLPILKRVVDAATDLVNAWLPTIKLWAEQVPAAIDATVNMLADYLRPAMEWLTTTGWPLLQAAAGAFVTYVQSIVMPILQTFWQMVAPTLQAALSWLTTTGFPLLQAAMAAYTDWLQTVAIPTLTSLWSWLAEKLSPVMTWLTVTAWPALQTAAAAVQTWIAATLVPTLTSWWSWLFEKIEPVFEWFISTGWPALGNAANSVQNWIQQTLVPTLGSWYEWLDQKLQPIYQWFTQTGWPALQTAGATVATWLTGTLFPILSEWWDWLQARLSPIYQWFTTTGWPALQTAGAAVAGWLSGTLFPVLSEWYQWLQDRLSPIFSWFIDDGWPQFQTAGAYVWGWLTTNLIPALQDWTSWMGDKAKTAGEWWIDHGFPDLTTGFQTLNPEVEQGTRDWQAFAGELAKTDAAESWVTILENLSKFGKYLIEHVNLAQWFNDVGAGAQDAGGWAGYFAEAVAWIARTLAKFSKLLPGVDVPSVEAPPKAPSGGSGGGGGGGGSLPDLPSRGSVPPARPPSAPAPTPPPSAPAPTPPPSAPAPTPPSTPAPTPPSGSGGIPKTEVLGGGMEVENYIRSVATNLGIDPNVAVAVANTEGGARDYMQVGNFVDYKPYTGMSYWPFQLHYGGKGTPYADWGSATTAGMGNGFTKATSWQPGDWRAWQASTLWALGVAKQDGWSQWYGAAAHGISKWQGIPGHAAGGWVGLHGPELGIFGERGPEYVVPNAALRGGGSMQHIVLDVALDGRTMERIYVSGRDIALRRGRSTAGVGTTGNLLAGAPA